MNPRVTWTLAAILCLVLFFGARFFIAAALVDGEEQALEETRTHKPPPKGPVDARPRPREPRQPGPMDPLWDVVGGVEALYESGEDERDQVIRDAHVALDRAVTLDLPWNATEVEKMGRVFGALERQLRDDGHRSLATHVLSTQVDLARKAGHPDDAAAQRLEALERSSPAEFDWR